jgi:hypothetical protein
MNAADHKNIALRLESERKVQEGQWQEIERYICPFRGEFMQSNATEGSVTVHRPDIFDGTGIQSAQNLAANLHGNLTSPFYRWFDLQFRNEELKESSEARAWLEEVGEAMWQALVESDFSLEVAEIYMDLVCFGNAALITEIGADGKLDFTAVPLKEFYFEEGFRGNAKSFYRILNWTYVQIVDKFGSTNVPEFVRDKAASPQGSAERARVIFCIWQRGEGKPDPAFRQLPPKRRAFGYQYILESDCSLLGKEGGYYEMPAHVVRWAKMSESRWGHGPAHIAVYDVKTLNRQEELMLQALAKVIDPPMVVSERGLIGDLNMQPGGLSVVKDPSMIRPLQDSPDLQAVNMEREQRRNMIREYFFGSRLDLKESPAMTATEVERRWQQMQKLLGPTLGRMQSELLDPVVNTVFMTMWRAGLLPAMPPEMANMKADMDIEYTGPIPMSQKQDKVQGIEREINVIGQAAQLFGPDVMDVMDISKAIREHALMSGVPASVIRSDVKIKQMQDERKEAQQKQQGMAEAQQAAMVAKDMGSAAKDAAAAGMDPADMMGGAGAEQPVA